MERTGPILPRGARSRQDVAVSRPTVEAGDEQAFADLIAPHLRELHVHCYRMLGSVTDAEDVLQEVLTAAWRGLDTFAGRSSMRTWLYRIATNRCLNAIRDGNRRTPPEPVPPFDPPEPSRRGDVTWLQPYPDRWIDELDEIASSERGPATRYESREAIELAFVTALQRLPPRQLAALLLCDVLGYSAAEAADLLDTTGTAIKGSLQRARASVDQPRAVPAAGSASDHALARRFADALSADDIDGVVALLSDDAWLAMPPAPHEYHGPIAIASFLRASADSRGEHALVLTPTGANNQPAFGMYFSAPDSVAYPTGLLVLTVRGEEIIAITRFLDDRLPALFGLGAGDID
jgi:RNA polymerase sigma-70 factor (TIGR02960 family)